MPDKNPSFTLLFAADRKLKLDEAPVASETWRVVLALNCETCGKPIIDAEKAVVVLQGTSLEVDPNQNFLGRVEKRTGLAGDTATEFFYSIPGRVVIAHGDCERPTGLCVPASMVLATHTPLADYRPGFPMADTLKLPN